MGISNWLQPYKNHKSPDVLDKNSVDHDRSLVVFVMYDLYNCGAVLMASTNAADIPMINILCCGMLY